MGGRGMDSQFVTYLDGQTHEQKLVYNEIYQAINKASTTENKNQTTHDWITTHQSEGTILIANPATEIEHEAYMVVLGAIPFYFDTLTASAIIAARELIAGDTIPPLLKAAITAIMIVPEDLPGSPATIAREDDGTITIFGDRVINAGIIGHEAAHAFAEDKWGSPAPPEGSDYMAAINSDEPNIGEYAGKSPGEDFAESARLFITNASYLKKIAPQRFKIMRRLMWDSDYGG